MKDRVLDSVRASMARLPKILQWYLTWLTSKALPGQRPLFRNSWKSQTMTGFGLTLLGAMASLLLYARGGWALLALPLAWLVTVCGSRYLQTNILHQASHNRLTGDADRDRQVANFAAALVVIPPYDQYKAAHMPHHTPGTFASIHDPDFRFFRRLGFEPGLPMAETWKRLWMAVFGPNAHGTYLGVRLRSNFVIGSARQRLLATAIQAGMALGMFGTAGLGGYILGWLVPLTVLFQMSSVLQYITEHRWLLMRKPGEPQMFYLNQLTVARFTGEAAPAIPAKSLKGVIAWAAWWVRMLTYHQFFRIFVTQGPLGVHDFHHREPLSAKWPESVYERQRQIDSGHPRFADYAGVWGFRHSLALSLKAISDAPPINPQDDLTREEVERGFMSM